MMGMLIWDDSTALLDLSIRRAGERLELDMIYPILLELYQTSYTMTSPFCKSSFQAIVSFT